MNDSAFVIAYDCGKSTHTTFKPDCAIGVDNVSLGSDGKYIHLSPSMSLRGSSCFLPEAIPTGYEIARLHCNKRSAAQVSGKRALPSQ
jgi:hypothetical protein